MSHRHTTSHRPDPLEPGSGAALANVLGHFPGRARGRAGVADGLPWNRKPRRPSELRAACEALGLSQAEFARQAAEALGVAEDLPFPGPPQ